MSRETQFIGLTEAAMRYVKNLVSLESDLVTHGMFDEEIPLRRWKMPENKTTGEGVWNPERTDGQLTPCVREVVQCVPWSSGPMIFTCLAFDWGNTGDTEKGGFKPDYGNTVFEWVTDPTLGNIEYDQVTGRMWE